MAFRKRYRPKRKSRSMKRRVKRRSVRPVRIGYRW